MQKTQLLAGAFAALLSTSAMVAVLLQTDTPIEQTDQQVPWADQPGADEPPSGSANTSPATQRGPAGEAGLTGSAGANGTAGPAGEAGLTGSADANETAGPAGAEGRAGTAGAAGAAGATGTAGSEGSAGAPGAQGPQGSDGKDAEQTPAPAARSSDTDVQGAEVPPIGLPGLVVAPHIGVEPVADPTVQVQVPPPKPGQPDVTIHKPEADQAIEAAKDVLAQRGEERECKARARACAQSGGRETLADGVARNIAAALDHARQALENLGEERVCPSARCPIPETRPCQSDRCDIPDERVPSTELAQALEALDAARSIVATIGDEKQCQADRCHIPEDGVPHRGVGAALNVPLVDGFVGMLASLVAVLA